MPGGEILLSLGGGMVVAAARLLRLLGGRCRQGALGRLAPPQCSEEHLRNHHGAGLGACCKSSTTPALLSCKVRN